jgi:FAD/FMN-containing dehydrogenase
MQGGISFLSAQHGMAADNILEYEMVLANGSIVTISQQRNPSTVRALRGGGDQVGRPISSSAV